MRVRVRVRVRVWCRRFAARLALRSARLRSVPPTCVTVRDRVRVKLGVEKG
mgnify:CR=1 FL=1